MRERSDSRNHRMAAIARLRARLSADVGKAEQAHAVATSRKPLNARTEELTTACPS